MRMCGWLALGWMIAPIMPAFAQTAQTTPSLAQVPPPQPTGTDIVVEGRVDAPSDWKRAETAHVIVTSKGSEAELQRLGTDLEQLHHLMSRLYRRDEQPDDTRKLQVILLDSAKDLDALGVRNLRSEEGPYAPGFAVQRYYDPREDGELLVVARSDQSITLNTARANDQDYTDNIDNGGDGTPLTTNGTYRPPVARNWEASLHSAFAQHFILTYLPAAYPRWYIDGIGALYSTFKVRADGSVDYALPPPDYRQVFRSYGALNVADVLTGRYLAAPSAKMAPKTAWTPYHAWLLAHFFLFSPLKPERRDQFARYMTAVHQGTSMADAARIFGDMRTLQREVSIYIAHDTRFARTEPSRITDDPLVTTLSRSSAALLDARIAMGTLRAPGAGEVAAAPDWLARLRTTARADNAEAMLTLAEAECRSGHDTECLAAADRVLARSPANVRALSWKGTALVQQAIAGPAATRAAGLTVAREAIDQAIQRDGSDPLPRTAYFRSFVDAGERVPDPAMRGMAVVIRAIPAAPAPRLYLAQELLRQGQGDLARRVVYPVLYGAYDSPEKTAARSLFAQGSAAPRPSDSGETVGQAKAIPLPARGDANAVGSGETR